MRFWIDDPQRAFMETVYIEHLRWFYRGPKNRIYIRSRDFIGGGP